MSQIGLPYAQSIVVTPPSQGVPPPAASKEIHILSCTYEPSKKFSKSASEDAKSGCPFKNCVLCLHSWRPNFSTYRPSWREIAIAAFTARQASDAGRTWLSLTDDIYPLLLAHWDLMCPNRDPREEAVWRKQLQDALSHSKKHFVSGWTVFGQTGYWRLRDESKDEHSNQPQPMVFSLPLQAQQQQQQVQQAQQQQHQEMVHYLQAQSQAQLSQQAMSARAGDATWINASAAQLPPLSPQQVLTQAHQQGHTLNQETLAFLFHQQQLLQEAKNQQAREAQARAPSQPEQPSSDSQGFLVPTTPSPSTPQGSTIVRVPAPTRAGNLTKRSLSLQSVLASSPPSDDQHMGGTRQSLKRSKSLEVAERNALMQSANFPAYFYGGLTSPPMSRITSWPPSPSLSPAPSMCPQPASNPSLLDSRTPSPALPASPLDYLSTAAAQAPMHPRSDYMDGLRTSSGEGTVPAFLPGSMSSLSIYSTSSSSSPMARASSPFGRAGVMQDTMAASAGVPAGTDVPPRSSIASPPALGLLPQEAGQQFQSFVKSHMSPAK